MIAPKMPSRTPDKYDVRTRTVPVHKAFSLSTRRSNHQPNPRIQAKIGTHEWVLGHGKAPSGLRLPMNSEGRSPACPVAVVRSPRCHTSRGSAGWSINQTLKAKFEREV